MADENVGLDLASQTGQEDIVEAINGLKNLLSRLSDLLTLGSKTITQNGIYNPADDGFDGYSQVNVDIQLYTNDTTYESEVKIDDVSGFTKLYSTTIPYGSSGSKVSTQLSVTDENSIETLMNNGWESGAFYDSENQIGAYAGYSFGRNANITKCKLWLGRYSGQNKSLFVTVQYLNANDEWVDLETLDISTTIPYPVNIFEVAVGRTVKGIRWIHKDQPQKSGDNNIVFFGMTLYENVEGSDGVNVYRPTKNGLITPPEGYAGFGNLLINDGSYYTNGFELPSNSEGSDGQIFFLCDKKSITNTLGQYINTGYSGNDNSKYIVEFEVTKSQSTNWPTIFGARSDAGSINNASSVHMSVSEGNYSGFQVAWGTAGNNIPGYNMEDYINKIIIIELSNGLLRVSIDGESTSFTINATTVGSTTPIGLLSFLINGSVQQYGMTNGIKLYEFQIYENNVLVHDFIPSLDNNVPCIYDTVDKVYKYNAGSGDFIYTEEGSIRGIYIKKNGIWQKVTNINSINSQGGS